MSYRNHVEIKDSRETGVVLELRETWHNAGKPNECWKWHVMEEQYDHGRRYFREVEQEHAGTLTSALLVAACYLEQYPMVPGALHPETEEVLARVTGSSIKDPDTVTIDDPAEDTYPVMQNMQSKYNIPMYPNTKEGC